MNEIVTTGAKSIYLCNEHTDMRLGLPGLYDKINSQVKGGFNEKALYIFVSKNLKRIKLFYWDKNGYALWYKYTPEHLFEVDFSSGYRKITGINLKKLLSIENAIRLE